MFTNILWTWQPCWHNASWESVQPLQIGVTGPLIGRISIHIVHITLNSSVTCTVQSDIVTQLPTEHPVTDNGIKNFTFHDLLWNSSNFLHSLLFSQFHLIPHLNSMLKLESQEHSSLFFNSTLQLLKIWNLQMLSK